MNLRAVFMIVAAGLTLTLVWGYAHLPFPGRYAVTAGVPGDQSSHDGGIYRLDTWTGEVCVTSLGPSVVLPAGAGVPYRPK